MTAGQWVAVACVGFVCFLVGYVMCIVDAATTLTRRPRG